MTLTVTQVNEYIKMLLDADELLGNVLVKGEISNFTNHRTGHFYFSLKDEGGILRAVMFKSYSQSLPFVPENGMKVIAHGRVSSFVRDGQYQMYVDDIQPDGVGALYIAYEQLKNKLEAQGLFDPARKKKLPRIPRRIGIVTSPTGAAIRDMLNILSRRFPHTEVVLYPTLVQGPGAAAQIIEGVEYFNKTSSVDVIIVGRGGGSIEDLWAFNGEMLARRIYNANVPIISAVGHETDFTICDFVADMRAPTPSAAAELSVPDKNELVHYIDYCLDRCDRAIENKIAFARERLNSYTDSVMSKDAVAVVADKRERIGTLYQRVREIVTNGLERSRAAFMASAGKLEALSPVSVLTRGYGIVSYRGVPITDSKKVECGDVLDITLSNGKISAVVTEKKEENNVSD